MARSSAPRAPRLTQMGLAAKPRETPAQILAREQLVTLLVSEARDLAIVSELKVGVDVALSGQTDNTVPPPDLMGEAMRGALLAGGAAEAARCQRGGPGTCREGSDIRPAAARIRRASVIRVTRVLTLEV